MAAEGDTSEKSHLTEALIEVGHHQCFRPVPYPSNVEE